MKKIFLSFVIGLFIVPSAQAQSYLKKYNEDFMIGFQYATVDYSEDVNKWGMAIDISLMGVYLDIGGTPKSHDDEWKSGKTGEWEDEYTFFIHAGYQFPIYKYFKITPLIGYYYHSIGTNKTVLKYRTTDGSVYVTNDYKGSERLKGFNYGLQGQLNIPIGKATDLAVIGTYTKNIWMVGLGIVIRTD